MTTPREDARRSWSYGWPGGALTTVGVGIAWQAPGFAAASIFAGGFGLGLLIASAFSGFFWWWAVGAAFFGVMLVAAAVVAACR